MLYNEDSLEILQGFDDSSIDSLITDPPAGINFMGKDWDKACQQGSLLGIFKETLRVLKPGAHGLVWALPRTSHRTATALETAGFEIRDVIMHIFGSGFPKSLDISKAIDKACGAKREIIDLYKRFNGKKCGPIHVMNGSNYLSVPENKTAILFKTAPSTEDAKQWEGWGSALKPAHENWILVRKPLSEKNIAKNVLKHGCGVLNIDESRIALNGEKNPSISRDESAPRKDSNGWQHVNRGAHFNPAQASLGRFPANLVLSHHEDCDDVKCHEECAVKGLEEHSLGTSRYFYCAKASISDKGADNTHPTAKSTKLMEYLIRLITPPRGLILDPFMGSGSTGVAAKRLGFAFYGIERDPHYFEIACRRIGETTANGGKIKA